MRLDPASNKPARQPEAVAASLIGQRDPADRPASTHRLVPPALDQSQQCRRIWLQFLQRLARWLIARGIEAHVIHSASVAVSRERKRAKTDRLDAAMLMRVFLGWLRGERGHCGMVAIPTMEEEDARRPSRERESLVNERSRITNRMKSALARLGVRGFKPHLRKAPERLAGLRTAEGTGLPANIIEEFRRDMARLALVREQISSIEKTRAERLERAPDTGPHAMVRLLARVIGIGIETADMLVREILSRKLRDRRAVARYAGLTGSPGTPRIFRCILIRKALSGLRNANTGTAELLRLTSFVAVHRAASATISS